MGLTSDGCKARRERLLELVEADLLIISNPRHIYYFSNLWQSPLALSGWGPLFLLMETSSGRTRLLVHDFLASAAHGAFADEVEVYPWYTATADPGVNFWPVAVKALNKQLQSYSAKRVGIELGSLPFGVEIKEWVDLTGIIRGLRRSKDEDEVALIRQAVRAVEAGHRAARATIRPGITELEVYNAIYAAIVNEAGEAVLPLGDFASGDRAHGGGGPATSRVLRSGEVMLLDIFPIIEGYRADFTATLAVDGSLTPKQQALETALHAAVAAGERMLRPGNSAGDVYRAVYQALEEHDFAEGFGHHAGHGIGLGHPEGPFLVPNSEELLVVGDVVTLEPGSYSGEGAAEGFGGRIEHNYLITETGFERLTNHRTGFS